MTPDTYTYRLPDGTLITVAADLCKGASVITYTLKGGRIVDAIIVATPTPSLSPRFMVLPHTYLDLHSWQVIDRQAAARRLPRVYESYSTEASARACAAALNREQTPIAHYADNVGCGVRVHDWATRDIRRVTCQRCIDYIQTHLTDAPRAIDAKKETA